MNCFLRFIELTLPIDTVAYGKQLRKSYKRTQKRKGGIYPTDCGHADETLFTKGIGVAFEGNRKKKKIRFVVHPAAVIDRKAFDMPWEPSNENIIRLISKLEKTVDSYFQGKYQLNNFNLTQMNFAVDIDVGSRNTVSDYIRVLNNIGRVKCFSPMKFNKHGGVTRDDYFGLTGNTNGVEFLAYRQKGEKRFLRVEVRLITKEAIRAGAGDCTTKDLVMALAQGADDILMGVFQHIVPRGDYYKKPEVDALIRKRVQGQVLRRKMLRLATLIPEKKSLHLAQKALNARDIKEVMSAFAEIDVSPVPLSKRHDVKTLRSLYSYLES